MSARLTSGRPRVGTLIANFPDTYKLMKQDEVSKTIICKLSQAKGGQHRAEEQARQMMIERNNTLNNSINSVEAAHKKITVCRKFTTTYSDIIDFEKFQWYN